MMRASVLAAMAVGLASMGAADALSIRADKASPAETVPVTVYVYRHGNSCQNIATQCQNKAEGCDPNYDFEIIDSTLSDWGVDGSKNQSKVIPQPDLVMTSTLLRAVETGLYQFPKNQIYPVPWIKEVDYKPPNVPEIVSKQNATITQMDGAKNAARVNYTYEADPDHVCADKDPVPKCGANWEKFLEFLGTTLSDNPPEEVAQQIKKGKPISIALVSHSIMLSSNILKKGGYISNNQGWSDEFTLDLATKTIAPNNGSEWKEVTPGITSPCNGKSITLADTERCVERNPDTWPEFQKTCLR